MLINKIKISNILGIEELNFEPGKYVEISGKNGSGKTSVVEAIKAALKGGNDVTLIRNGSEKGEIAIEFDNGMVLNKSISNKSDLKLLDQNGNKVNKPQSQLDMLYDLLSVNPVEFLTTDKKSRARVLLESLPIELSSEELKSVMSGYASNLTYNTEGNALEVLDKIYEIIYGERREINRAIKEKSYAINQLQESLVEVDFNPDEIESKIKDLDSKQDIRRKMKDELIENINAELRKVLDEIEKLKYDAIQESIEQKEAITSKYEEKYLPTQQELATLKEQLKHVGGAMKTKSLITQYNSEKDLMDNNSNELSNSLILLEQMKMDKLNNLPIKGLTIKDGEIFKDEVIFDRLNTAEQIKVAVELAKLRAGEIGLVCVDGLERFDNTTYEMFKQEMLSSGLQAIVTKVSNEDKLTIK